MRPSGRPATSTEGLTAADLPPGAIDLVLVGGHHPRPDALAAAGATWCMPEVLPGATAADALAAASTPG